MSLPSINFLHLKVSEIQPGQTPPPPPPPPPADPDTMGENNTATALKGCEVKKQQKTTEMCYQEIERDIWLKANNVTVQLALHLQENWKLRG